MALNKSQTKAMDNLLAAIINVQAEFGGDEGRTAIGVAMALNVALNKHRDEMEYHRNDDGVILAEFKHAANCECDVCKPRSKRRRK